MGLPTDQRAREARAAVGDLNFFFDEDRPFAARDEPRRTTRLAATLAEALEATGADTAEARRSIQQRVVTNGLLRAECDHDQNIYLGKLFTRRLTRAVPDVVLQPVARDEVAAAMRWARNESVPVTIRGAASTAMGGAVPGDGGLLIDVSRLKEIEIDSERRRVRFGAGTRMRPLHRSLAAAGWALPVYPSNLGGTYAGWLATGGVGLNAFGNGRALDPVRSADLVLPTGDAVRLHADGSISLLDPVQRMSADEGRAWFEERKLPTLTLADLAGSEGQFGILTALEVEISARPVLHPFLLRFRDRGAACSAVQWIAGADADTFARPLELKLLSGSHLAHVRRVWRDDDTRDWRARPGTLSDGSDMPWRELVAPDPLSTPPGGSEESATETFVFVLFDGESAGAFVEALHACPGSPTLDASESVRFARDRFRPQQTKRIGPGLLAAEILLPAHRIEAFLPAAASLARGAGNELDAEVYYFGDGEALAIAGYLSDHRRASFAVDLMLAPSLLELAVKRFEGSAYVLGRWQAPHFKRKFTARRAQELTQLKRGVDPQGTLNPGAFFDLKLRGLLGGLLRRLMPLSILGARLSFSIAPPLVKLARKVTGNFRGGAANQGLSLAEIDARPDAEPVSRAIGCVNCGECNSVCPIFQESAVRLPQLLTHIGERAHAGHSPDSTGSTLLDLCMRCGNCEEVCQAGIPHLPLYGQLESQSERSASQMRLPLDRERHTLLLEHLRSSSSYVQDFLDIRPGGYAKRTPASLPGSARYVLMRAEGDAGPAATCIHCAACVDVCPTGANKEYEGDDPRLITTEQERCIGCGTCVEVCPANHANGGQTLRVMELPARAWFDAASEFAAQEAAR